MDNRRLIELLVTLRWSGRQYATCSRNESDIPQTGRGSEAGSNPDLVEPV